MRLVSFSHNEQATLSMVGPNIALAGALLTSLFLMGFSRKVFGVVTVSRRLVPHRADIGIATFFNIIVAVSVSVGLTDEKWGAGGKHHIVPAVLVQLGYLMSLVARKDLPPKHPHRLMMLATIWVSLTAVPAMLQVVLEVASLWVVKLRYPGTAQAEAVPAANGWDDPKAQPIDANTKARRGSVNPAKSKASKAGARMSGAGRGKSNKRR